MLASVSGFCLLRVGPFVIVVENNTFERNITVGGLILGTSDMSHAAVKVEQVLGLNLGYSTQSNFVIPKPAYNASRSGGLLHYDSDVIAFNHSCEWHAPSFNSTTQIAVIGSEEFTFNRFRGSPSPGKVLTDGLQFYPVLTSGPLASTTSGTGVFPLSQGDSPTGHSAFLIFGGNSTLKLNSDNFSSPDAVVNLTATPATGNTIDLSDFPVAYDASWFNFSSQRFTATGGGPLVFRAPLVTALLCNAHPVLTTGTVSLALNNLNVTLHHNYVGNINETDVPTYFTWAHHGVGDIQEYVATRTPSLFGDSGSSNIPSHLLVDFTALAAHIFLPETEPDAWPTASLRPLSLDQISLHMDALVLSTSKAQRVEATGSLGFASGDLLENSGPRILLAKEQTPDQILESNLLWLVLTAGFALLTLLLSIYISYRIDKEKQPPFDLWNIRENPIVMKK
ncbi:hypothetical protein AN958_08051 [Leucoagaricus sp. SymC.cos]|nr:hypothetical protein AN958_08051 [Leucoagaricus sp. SymC.cos]